MKNTIVGVDLAKSAIQVCVYANKKVRSNTEMTRHEFVEWLFNTSSTTVVFEACSTSNYWKQKAVEAGHAAHLISAHLVSTIRQNQKTDKNDALAIVQASLLPDISFIKGKTVDQQQLQSILRLRELAVRQKTASSNQLKALLLEFDIRVSPRNGGLGGQGNRSMKSFPPTPSQDIFHPSQLVVFLFQYRFFLFSHFLVGLKLFALELRNFLHHHLFLILTHLHERQHPIPSATYFRCANGLLTPIKNIPQNLACLICKFFVLCWSFPPLSVAIQ